MKSWSPEVVNDHKERDGSSEFLADFEVSIKDDQAGSRPGSYSTFSFCSDFEVTYIGGIDGNGDKSLGVSFVSSSQQSPQNDQMPPDGYQKSRIPSSIFRNNPAMDWSTASHESLFSIHVGSNSFSNDQFFALQKSGEMTKFDEQIIAQGLPPPSELDNVMMNENVEDSSASASAAAEMPKNTTMAVGDGEVAEKEHSQSKTAPPEEIQAPVNSTTTVDLGAVSENNNKSQAKVFNSPNHSISAMSDDSTISFVFPVLTSDAGRPSTGNEDRNTKGQKTKPEKQPEKQPEKPPDKQPEKQPIKEELPPQTPVTPQNNATGRSSWFSLFYCCRGS